MQVRPPFGPWSVRPQQIFLLNKDISLGLQHWKGCCTTTTPNPPRGSNHPPHKNSLWVRKKLQPQDKKTPPMLLFKEIANRYCGAFFSCSVHHSACPCGGLEARQKKSKNSNHTHPPVSERIGIRRTISGPQAKELHRATSALRRRHVLWHHMRGPKWIRQTYIPGGAETEEGNGDGHRWRFTTVIKKASN